MKTENIVFGILVPVIIAIILISGCAEQPTPKEEKSDCLYECCINGTYNAKECAAGYECKENKCVIKGLPPKEGEEGEKLPLWSYPIDDPSTIYWFHYPVSISESGEYIVLGTKEGVYLFQKDESTPVWSYQTEAEVHAVSISPDGSYIAASTEEIVYVFQRESNIPLWMYSTTVEDLIYGIESVAFSPDGDYIAVGYAFCVYWGGDGGVLLFKKDSNTPLARYQLSVSGFESVSVSPSANYIVAVEGMDGNVLLLQRLETRLVSLWTYYTGNILELEMSSDAEYIVIGGARENDELILLDKEGDVLWSYDNLGRIRSIAISSDGSYIAAGSQDDTLYLFQKDGSMLWSYDGSGEYDSWGSFTYISMSSNGNYIAANRANSLYVFQKDSDTPLWKINVNSLGDSTASVSDLFISADGKYLVLITDTLYLFTTEAPQS